MHGFWMMVREGGWGAMMALLLGFVGLLVGAGAGVTLVFSRRGAFYVGVAALVVSTLASGVGLLGMVSGRRATDNAIAAVTPIQSERIRREGYRESANAAKIGFGASAVPLLAGLLAVALGAGARPKTPPAFAPPMNAFAPPPPRPPSSGGRWIGGGVAASFALLTCIGAFAGNAAPLPKGKYDFAVDDTEAWNLAEARETFDSDQGRGCDDLDAALDPLWGSGDRRQWPRVFIRDPGQLVPDWHNVATMCAQAKWSDMKAGKLESTRPASPETFAPPAKTWNPDTLLDSPLLVDERIHSELLAWVNRPPLGLKLPGSVGGEDAGAGIGLGQIGQIGHGAGPGLRPETGPGSVRGGSATVSGRLPPEVIQRIVRRNMGRFRLCYESALGTNPTLEGTVKVKFVIGADGNVSSASDGGSDLPDPTVVQCVVRAVSSLVFPQPEGGIVVVTYPLHFAAAAPAK